MQRQQTQQTQNTATQHQNALQHERTEKKQEQNISVDNNYYSLNPWYDQQPDKPVFGLAQPLPREVRPGMLWGRQGLQDSLYKVDKKKDQGDQKQKQQGGRPGSRAEDGQPQRQQTRE
jgi:aquaglyceroporin related protein